MFCLSVPNTVSLSHSHTNTQTHKHTHTHTHIPHTQNHLLSVSRQMVDVGRNLKKKAVSQIHVGTEENHGKPQSQLRVFCQLLYPTSPENKTGVLTTEQSYRSTPCKPDLLKMSLNKPQIRKRKYPETFLKSLSLIPPLYTTKIVEQ